MRNSNILALIFIFCVLNSVHGKGNCNNGNATISCSKFTVGCNFPIFEYINEYLGIGNVVASIASKAGCTCQNNGLGPSCPAWLTCPDPFKPLVLAGYNLENIFSNNVCHCQCRVGECPGFDLKQDSRKIYRY